MARHLARYLPRFAMETRHKGALMLGYETTVPIRRTKPSSVPGWTFDAAVVAALIIAAVGCLTA